MRQREAASISDSSAHFVTLSLLARWLIEGFHFGFLSGPQVQTAASKAKTDGINNDVLDHLAGLGSNDRFGNKIAGELMKYMDEYLRPVVLPKPESIQVPMKIERGLNTGFHLIQQYYTLPHVWLAWMHKYFRGIYEARIQGPRATLLDFLEFYGSI